MSEENKNITNSETDVVTEKQTDVKGKKEKMKKRVRSPKTGMKEKIRPDKPAKIKKEKTKKADGGDKPAKKAFTTPLKKRTRTAAPQTGDEKSLKQKIFGAVRALYNLLPQKSDENAPLLDGNVKVLPQFCIQTKLIGCFIIPVILIVVLGIVSYSRSASALNENYEGAVAQTMNMTKEYFSFVFTNIESDMNVFLSDEELSEYYSGEYSTNDAQKKSVSDLKDKYEKAKAALDRTRSGSPAYYKAYKTMADAEKDYNDAKDVVQDAEDKEEDAYHSLNTSVSNKVVTNQFINNIYIFKDGGDIISSQTSLRSTAQETSDSAEVNSDTLGLYKAFLDTDLGKNVTGDTMKYHWCGPIPELDKVLSANTDEYMLRVAHDLSSTSDAVMIVDINRNAIMQILNDLNLGEGSYVGIITSDKQELVVEGKSLTTEASEEDKSKDAGNIVSEKIYAGQDFYENALKSDKESDSSYVRYNGKSYLFTYQKIANSGIMLCSLVPESIIVSQAGSIRILTIVMIIVACLIALLVGTLISNGFSKSINKSIKELEKVSKGDFTVEFRTNRRDEFALLYGSCNDMLANIRGLIMEVESIYDTLASSLAKVDSSSTTFSETTKNIQQSVHEVEIGVGEQTESAAACLTEMDSLFTKINNVNDNTNEIGNIASSTQDAINSGLTSVENLNEKTQSTTVITNNVIETIRQLSVHSNQIGQIVNSINDIAEETNLLSLNASIEAARAGAAGKGFSVVASQIRKLADQCLVSAGKISNIVKEITVATDNAVAIAKTAEQTVVEQEEAVTATAHSFQTLKQHIEDLSANLDSIQNSSKDMEHSGSSTLKSMENISAILEQTLALVTSVATITDKQSEALLSLDDASSKLMVRADRLGDAISRFKTK